MSAARSRATATTFHQEGRRGPQAKSTLPGDDPAAARACSTALAEADPTDALLLRVDPAQHRDGLARIVGAALSVPEERLRDSAPPPGFKQGGGQATDPLQACLAGIHAIPGALSLAAVSGLSRKVSSLAPFQPNPAGEGVGDPQATHHPRADIRPPNLRSITTDSPLPARGANPTDPLTGKR